MRALLVSTLLLLLAACGDEPRPTGPGSKVTVDGRTLDMSGWQDIATRPLTAADVEVFIAALPEWKRIGNKEQEMAQAAQRHGLSVSQWVMLQTRVAGVYMALKFSPDSVDEKIRADAAVVRPYMERIEAAMDAK